MEITDYHAKLYAHELTRQCASDEVDKLAPVLADAKVDLNPHQVEAALFAFQNPLGKGAVPAAASSSRPTAPCCSPSRPARTRSSGWCEHVV